VQSTKQITLAFRTCCHIKDVKIEEEIEEDSDFLKADEVVTCKRKIISNSKYLANQYDIN
jgi:hypothetical protein